MTLAPKNELTGRELLIDVASRLFMDHGYDGVSMQQIASAAKMTKGSPYYHFEGKEDLFLQTFHHHVVGIAEDFLHAIQESGSLREKLVRAFEYMLSTINPGMIRMLDDFQRLFISTGKITVREEDNPHVVMQTAYEDAFANAGLELRLPPHSLAEALIALQMGVMQMQMIRETTLAEEHKRREGGTFVEDVIDLFLNGATVDGDGGYPS